MKKYVNRTILACMAALSLLTGCNKEEKDSKVFLLEMPEYGTQKTALNTSTKGTEWINGDVIYINGATADNTATVTVGDGKAVAKATADIPSDGNLFYACYPGNSENIVSYDPNTHSFTFILPVSRNAGELKAPFVGIGSKKDATGDKVIRFLNTCALLKVSNIESKDIVITDAAGKLAGEFSVAYNGSSWDAISATVNNTATANCTLTVINSGTADVYIPIPAGNHRLMVVNGGKKVNMSAAQQFLAGHIYTAKYKNNKGHEYVDLGLSVLWATCNVGAKNPWDYGKYFAWGETESKSSYTNDNYNFNSNPTTLALANDAANQQWGGDWRMPTKAEWEELLEYCSQYFRANYSQGINGFLFTSIVEGYEDNSIFLPAAGYYNNSGYGNTENCLALYWSSTISSDNSEAWYLDGVKFGYSGGCSTGTESRYWGLTVRPVMSK